MANYEQSIPGWTILKKTDLADNARIKCVFNNAPILSKPTLTNVVSVSKVIGKMKRGEIFKVSKVWKMQLNVTMNAQNTFTFYYIPAKKGWAVVGDQFYSKYIERADVSSSRTTLSMDKNKIGKSNKNTADEIKETSEAEKNNSRIVAALKALGNHNSKASSDGTTETLNEFKSRYMITYSNKLKGLKAFNRYQYQNQFNVINGTREYIFFTKPKLNIMKSSEVLNSVLKDDPFWIEMRLYYRRIIAYLQGDSHGGMTRTDTNVDYRHEFIPLLTNMVAGNLDMPSKSAETVDTGANIYGTTMQYRKGSYKSDEGYDFSLEFYDTKWLDVYHFFRMWDEYSSLKDIGMIGPPGGDDCNGFRVNKRLHDQISIYKFIVDADDMSTILYYAKFTGCFPKSVPREAFGEIKEGIISYSIDWHAFDVEDMNPIILLEFNNLCDKYMKRAAIKKKQIKGHFDKSNENMRYADSGFVPTPYIISQEETQSSTLHRYKMVWIGEDK